MKISCFGRPWLPRLSPPLVAPGNGLRIADLLDLVGTRASVVQRRAEENNYRDIDSMPCDGRFELAAASDLRSRLFPQVKLKAQYYFGDGMLRRLSRMTKDRLSKTAREVDLDRLPTIT